MLLYSVSTLFVIRFTNIGVEIWSWISMWIYRWLPLINQSFLRLTNLFWDKPIFLLISSNRTWQNSKFSHISFTWNEIHAWKSHKHQNVSIVGGVTKSHSQTVLKCTAAPKLELKSSKRNNGLLLVDHCQFAVFCEILSRNCFQGKNRVCSPVMRLFLSSENSRFEDIKKRLVNLKKDWLINGNQR